MNKIALITGATSGIGLALAKEFAKNGSDLIIVSRNLENLKNTAKNLKNGYNIKVKIIQQDLAENNASQKVYDEIKKDNLKIEYLINNAGVGTWGKYSEIPWEKENNLLNLNIIALSHLTKLFLPELLKQKHGKILNVASMAAFQPGPLMASYFASKAYVLYLSEAIAEEIKNTEITISTLCPAATKTNFTKEANMPKTVLFSGKLDSPESIAKLAYKKMLKGKRIIVPNWQNKLLILINKLSPFSWRTVFAAKITQKK